LWGTVENALTYRLGVARAVVFGFNPCASGFILWPRALRKTAAAGRKPNRTGTIRLSVALWGDLYPRYRYTEARTK
jgi:hypothetical protein